MMRLLILIGVVFIVAGALWPWLSRLPIGRLPGDILIRRENFTFYMPITTGILLSILLSVILWLSRR